MKLLEVKQFIRTIIEQDQRSIAGPMRKWRKKPKKPTSTKQAGYFFFNPSELSFS